VIMNHSCALDDVQKALALEEFDALTAQLKMMPFGGDGRKPPDNPDLLRIGAVLLLLYCREDGLYLVLTRRRDDLPSHAGQISFPGGRQENGESLVQTALRETEEEIGVPATAVLPLGSLTPIYIPPSGYMVHPFVGWYQIDPPLHFLPADREVAEVIEVPLRQLLDPATAVAEPWDFHGHEVLVPHFALQGHKVWGATAIMLIEFVERLRTVAEISDFGLGIKD
jgi:8-oxo-dGTP pyrophosphatase MutT (NUDIX family)